MLMYTMFLALLEAAHFKVQRLDMQYSVIVGLRVVLHKIYLLKGLL